MQVFLSVFVFLALAGCTSPGPESGAARVTGEAPHGEQSGVPQNDRLGNGLPATFTGTLPCADCPGIDMHLNLLPDGAYLLRESYQDREVGPFFDIGRYLLSSDGKEVVLHGEREAPRQFEIVGAGELRLLDIDGQRIQSKLNYSVFRQPTFQALEPRLLLRGQYRYLAGAGRFRECLTGLEMPVATEGDNRALEEAYLAARKEPGEEIMVTLEGRFAQRVPMEGPHPVRTVVPERFIGIWPEQSCPSPIHRATLKKLPRSPSRAR